MASLPPPSAQPPAPESEPHSAKAEPLAPESEPHSATAEREAAELPPWPVWVAPAGLALGLGLGVLGSIAVEIAAAVGGSSLSHPSPAASIAADIAFDLGFVAAALYFTTWRGQGRPTDFGFRRVAPRTAVVAFVLAAIAYYGLTTVYASVLRLHGTDKLPSELGATHSTPALLAAAIFVCVVAPIAEEFFFRGFFFPALARWRIAIRGHDVGTWLAAVVTGLLFGLAHTGSAASQYLIPLGFLGFVLCIVRWKTGSLYPCIALHSANNALALGVNQLNWSAVEVVGLILATWLVVATITAPLAARSPRAP